MSDEDFQKAVMARFDHVDRRLDAIVRRLDEQDGASDLIVEKFDRLSVMVREAMSASEQALSRITDHSRRIVRLENRDD